MRPVSSLSSLWPGADVQSRRWGLWSPRAGGPGGGGRWWVRIWWLYCSHCHHHIITATARSKLPPLWPALRIKLSVIIWFWFLGATDCWQFIHNADAADCNTKWQVDSGNATLSSFLSSFMIGGLNRFQTGGTLYRKLLFKPYCEEIQVFLWHFCLARALGMSLSIIWVAEGT